MKTELKQDENIQFKILYFIGIILIVANHCADGISISLMYEWFPAYSFHLALFIFASGYFFINNKDKNILQFIKKIMKKFLIPLYIWNLVYGIFIMILHEFGIKFGANISINSLLFLPIYNGHQFILNLSSWFIWPLFIIQLINIFILKILKKNDFYYYIYSVISLLFGFIGVQLAINGYNKEYFLLLTRVLYFFPFFSFGMLYRTKLEKHDNRSNLSYFIILFSITLIVIYKFNGIKTYTPSWCNDFDNFYHPFIVGFLGIAFWLRISRILVPSLKDSKFVNIISKNTFSIMMHHLTGFFVLNCLWCMLSKLFSVVNGFDYVKFKSTVFYSYCPKGITQFKILYLLFGLVFPLIVVYIIDIKKKKI